MRTKIWLLVLILFLISGGASQIQYDIEADKEKMKMNTTVKLECENPNCPVNQWTLSLDRPEGAEVIKVESLEGEEASYNIYGDKISVETFMEEPGRTETVFVRYQINNSADEIVDGLYQRKISLPGFRGESNSGRVKADEMISGRISKNFEQSLRNDTFKFRGEGPANADIAFGDGHTTKYFEFFGGQPDDTEEAYEVAVGTMGFAHWLEKIPVALMDSKRYNETVNKWSAGRYLDGYIAMRTELEEDFKPILAHETVHALNDQALVWDDTSSRWFDEGVGKYVEFLMTKKMEGQSRTRELFGEKRTYTERENGDRYRYTLPPKGDKEKLYNYYNQDFEFMKRWNSQHTERRFGYAYSELIIRNYVSRMNGSISELYSQLGPDNRLDSNEEKWQYYSDFLDLTPCKYDSRKKFEECIDEINNYDYPVYIAESIDKDVKELNIEEIKIPEKKTSKQGENSFLNDSNKTNGSGKSLFQRIMEALDSFVASFF